ncbi:MAG: murein biosynthesis integral membrane protein MurJ [Kiritimatiellae bacterium]|nr:murein biosynthesis integral membrane protein MurJ [Kiritimatiellia bacterium]
MENKNVIRWAFAVGGFTMLSRILGLAREMLMAKVFGTTLAMSAFVVAFRIPNLFRALFGEGALSAALVPVYQETRRNDGESEGWRLVRRVTTLVGAFLLTVTALGIVGMSVALARPEALSEKWAAVLPLARVMLPYVFFICMAAMGMAALNAHRKFSVAAFTPALLNITMILSLLFVVPLAREGGKMAVVAWTVFAAGAVQMVYQMPALWREGWRPGTDWNWRDERVKRVFLLMGPGALGMAVNQVNVMLSSILALHAGSWAPSALYYAERLIYLPQGILAVSLGTVLLSVLSDYAAQGQWGEVRESVHHGLRTLLFVMTPAALGLCALAEPVVRMLLERGEFNEASTAMTARALRFYAPGLMVFCLAKVFVPAFYAQQDTKTPVKIGMVSVGLCCLMNVASVAFLPTYWKHAGLALSTVLAECFTGTMLAVCLRRRLGPLGVRGILAGFSRALGAAAAMSAAAWWVERTLRAWLCHDVWWMPTQGAQGVACGAAIAVGAAIYFGIARAFRFPELGFVAEALAKKRKKKAAA